MKGIVAAHWSASSAWNGMFRVCIGLTLRKQKTQCLRKTLCPFRFVVTCTLVDPYQQPASVEARALQILLERANIVYDLLILVLAARFSRAYG